MITHIYTIIDTQTAISPLQRRSFFVQLPRPIREKAGSTDGLTITTQPPQTKIYLDS